MRIQPEHPTDRFRRKTKNKVQKEAEEEVVYLSTQPQHSRDSFRDKVKDKNGTKNKTGEKVI